MRMATLNCLTASPPAQARFRSAETSQLYQRGGNQGQHEAGAGPAALNGVETKQGASCTWSRAVLTWQCTASPKQCCPCKTRTRPTKQSISCYKRRMGSVKAEAVALGKRLFWATSPTQSVCHCSHVLTRSTQKRQLGEKRCSSFQKELNILIPTWKLLAAENRSLLPIGNLEKPYNPPLTLPHSCSFHPIGFHGGNC